MNSILDKIFGKNEEEVSTLSDISKEISDDIENRVSNFESESIRPEEKVEDEIVAEEVENIEDENITVAEANNDDSSAKVLSPYDALSEIKTLIDKIPSTDFEIVNLKQQIYLLLERVQ